MHFGDDDSSDEYEALGLRVLLRAAVSAEDYALATKERCIALGVEEQRRVSAITHQVYCDTLMTLKAEKGRMPTDAEFHEAMAVAMAKVKQD